MMPSSMLDLFFDPLCSSAYNFRKSFVSGCNDKKSKEYMCVSQTLSLNDTYVTTDLKYCTTFCNLLGLLKFYSPERTVR